MNCGWTCLRLRIGFLISTHAYLYLMVNSLGSILSWREESRRKRSEEWLIWNNWLCTDFTWPSANSFFFSSPFHLVRISGRILMAVITLKWPDIPLMSFIHDFCWHSEALSPSFREKRGTDRKIVLILLVIWTCMCMQNHLAPGLHWLSVVLCFFLPIFFPFTSPLINNLLSLMSFQTRILSFLEHKVRVVLLFSIQWKCPKLFWKLRKTV